MIQTQLLKHVTWQCIHFTDTNDAARVLREVDERSYVAHATFDESAPLAATIGKAFGFPDYFGGTWDGLAECLRDLQWAPASSYLLFIDRATELWAKDIGSASLLVDCWLTAAEKWSTAKVPFHLVFVR
jgi:hypothetical protein